ncbi:NAD(P)-binding domain-containing protein [bacterium]|nr:NAD(P)-binding domain-containing protein [bacterium]
MPEPSYPPLPEVGESAESNVPGVYLLGEIAGVPLIKLGLNQGVEIAEKLAKELGPPRAEDPALLDLVIVGAGSSGLGAAARAHELGMRYVVLEGERIATIVINMYKGKVLFAEPVGVPNRSSLWFEECTREELLDRWRKQVAEKGLHVQEHEKVTDVQRSGEHFKVTSTRGEYRARRVLLALGKSGNPRKAGVPGEKEHAAKIHHVLSDPSEHEGKRIFIYGGGDVAAEAALALSKNNKVTMVTIDKALTFPKKRNVDALLAEKAAGRLELHLGTSLVKIDAGSMTYRTADGQETTIPNDLVFEMIGAELPLGFFKKVGIKLEGTWDLKRWLVLAATFLGAYSLYALKKFPHLPFCWPFNHVSKEGYDAVLQPIFKAAFAPFSWMFSERAFADILDDRGFQQGYLYSLLYTVVMLVFGIQAFRRWSNIARDNTYQKWRYVSLISFQVGFFFIANVLAVQALTVKYAWRAWGLYQPWPLFFNTFDWWDPDPDATGKIIFWSFVGFGLFLTFVAIPYASLRHGKRFCTWICGCGGLAETLGDRWRHNSAKGKRSRSWEFQGALVLAAAALVTVVVVGAYQTSGDNPWWLAYSYTVDFWLVGVIPIALYPFFGGKVWCRYWCPLAAWNQILARWYGKLEIKSNEKCISCTMCSRHCQVGVDVMAFAKNQQPFDNRNSGCIQCGICIDVCPMGVLEFNVRGKRLEVVGDAAAKV